jgi:Protein of unknown function (DUF3551)
MKRILFVLAGALVALVGDPRPGAAREWYPWCAQTADQRAIVDCSFTTFEQCRATLSGIGGSCVQNARPPPPGPPRDRRYQPFYR